MHSRRLLAKSEGNTASMTCLARESIRNNPFLGLSTHVSPRLWPACPAVRSTMSSPSSGTLHREEVRTECRTRKPGLRLRPIKIIKVPRPKSMRSPGQTPPISSRPVRTPFFLEVPLLPPKAPTALAADEKPGMRRAISLKTLRNTEVNFSFGSLSLKRTQLL
jgi:hypothetical protein